MHTAKILSTVKLTNTWINFVDKAMTNFITQSIILHMEMLISIIDFNN